MTHIRQGAETNGHQARVRTSREPLGRRRGEQLTTETDTVKPLLRPSRARRNTRSAVPSARVHWRSSCGSLANQTGALRPHRRSASCQGQISPLWAGVTAYRGMRRCSAADWWGGLPQRVGGQQWSVHRQWRQVAIGKEQLRLGQREITTGRHIPCAHVVVRGPRSCALAATIR